MDLLNRIEDELNSDRLKRLFDDNGIKNVLHSMAYLIDVGYQGIDAFLISTNYFDISQITDIKLTRILINTKKIYIGYSLFDNPQVLEFITYCNDIEHDYRVPNGVEGEIIINLPNNDEIKNFIGDKLVQIYNIPMTIALVDEVDYGYDDDYGYDEDDDDDDDLGGVVGDNYEDSDGYVRRIFGNINPFSIDDEAPDRYSNENYKI